MFEKLYFQEIDTINKKDYNLLYEEYKSLQENIKKLEHRLNLIIKQSDRHFLKNITTISTQEKENKRANKIFKISDKQGRSLLDKTYILEEDLEDELEYERELLKEITNTQKEVIFTMGAIGESRSQETGNHVKRVAEYSKILATLYGLDAKQAELLKEASPMHDIGKVAIPDAILNKQGSLYGDEWITMKSHAELGYQMLKHSNRLIFKAAAIVAKEHHEKWDGSGYPNALKANDIHIFGRITALADVFDALSSDRCYKKAWSDEKVFQFLKDEKGKHFEPKLVDIFFENIDTFIAIREDFKDL